jgi:amino acid transporter
MENSLRAAAAQFQPGRSPRRLGTRQIVFLVIAAAAPLTAMVGNLPIALGRGNGVGLPGAFLVATLTLICFAFGYAQMSRRVVSTGAFYTYVTMGLGRPVGVASAYIAAFAYGTLTVGLAVAFGFFTKLVLQGIGMEASWLVCALPAVVLTALMGYRSINVSSTLLQVLLLAEIAVLLIFDASVLAARGTLALPAQAFAPAAVFGPGFAIGLMFAFTSFIGFEAAALFGEESHEPTKSIPRATLLSVLLIGLFYVATVWITIGAAAGQDVAALARDKGGEFLFVLMAQYLGEPLMQLAAVLLCTSLLATYLAIHNAASRYLFALGREKLLPQALGRFNPRRYAPSNASLAVSVGTLACVAAFQLASLDIFTLVMPSLIGIATLGVILLQALASAAICVYFARQKWRPLWSGVVAPGVGALGLFAASVLVIDNFALLTSVDTPLLNHLPLIYAAIALAGLGFALWLRARRPSAYEGIGQAQLRAHDARGVPGTRHAGGGTAAVNYTDRYCIVGAGPSGLLAARAFKLQGIPYDQFERHADVGGIWDMTNPGTPMYESAHFISSKYTSAFFGYPMPEHYPDYPNHRQILDYIRSFADAFGLRQAVRFSTGVARAEPLGDGASGGWRVTLENGEIHHYKGVVCATGVTWHPNLPSYPGLERYRGEARHTNTHRQATELKGRRVLIVGCGNSGADIACDAARNASSAWLSVRRGYRFVPKHIFGVPTDLFIGARLTPPKGVVVPDDVSAMLDAVVGDLTRLGLPAPDHQAMESHPIMNTQVLHHLAHGDLVAKPDIRHFTETGAVFADGSEAHFDLVLFATGYDYKLPYLDPALFEWRAGHPQLYLNIFHRHLAGLSVLGFVEFADAGYQRFDEMAQMVAMDAHIAQTGEGRTEWLACKAGDGPNLRGAMRYVDSPRHTNYVDVTTYRRVLAELRARFGWFDPTHSSYESLLRQAHRSEELHS